MRRHSTILAIVISLSVMGCQTTVGVDEATHFFNEVAFRGSYGGQPLSGKAAALSNFETHRLRKWMDPLRVSITGEVPDGTADYVHEIFEAAARSTNLNYTIVEESIDDPNFTISFEPKGKFVINNVEHVRCYAHSRAPDGRVATVDIHIGIDENAYVRHCIIHEILHGLGFQHGHSLPSAVNYTMQAEAFSRWDTLALSVLYNDRIEPGMTRSEALPIARKLIGEMMERGH